MIIRVSLVPRLAALMLCLGACGLAPAEALEPPLVALIPPSGGPYTLAAAALPRPPRAIRSAAFHGSVRLAGQDLVYAPDLGFWALGSDRFVYDADGGGVTVVLVRATWPVAAGSDFERPLPSPWRAEGTRLQIGLRGAVFGRGGLGITAGATDAFVAIGMPPAPEPSLPSPPLADPGGDAGHGVSTGGTIVIDANLLRPAPEIMTLYEAAPDASAQPGIRLYLTKQGDGYGLVAGTLVDGVPAQQTPQAIPLSAGPHRWSLEWWRLEPGATGPTGLRLTVDDGLPASLSGASSGEEPELADHRFGSIEVKSTTPPPVRMDNLWIRRGALYGDELGPAASAVMVADVQRQSAWRWDRGPVWNEPGEWTSLAPPVAGGSPWRLDLSDPETVYNVRVVLQLGREPVREETLLLVGESAPQRGQAREVMGLRLRAAGAQTLIQAFAGDAATAAAAVAGPHVVELQWRAATSETARDGLLRLWLDGAAAGAIGGIGGQIAISALRLAPGRPGTAWAVDALETWY